jgi:hypothetical protein
LSSDSEGRTLFDEHDLRQGEKVGELFRIAQEHQMFHGSIAFVNAGQISWDTKDKKIKDPKAIAALESAGLRSKENELLELQRNKLKRFEKELADLHAEDAKDEAKEKEDAANGFGSPLISTRPKDAISKKSVEVENIKEAVLKFEMDQMARINETNAKLVPFRVGDLDGCMAASNTQFTCVNNAVVNAEVKGDLLLTLYDEYDPSKRIDLKITNAEGLPEQKGVLFSVTRFMQAGGVAHLEKGNCSLTLAGQTIRISDDCQLRTTVVMPKAKDDSAWMTVEKGKPIARGPTSGAAHAAAEPMGGSPAAAKND